MDAEDLIDVTLRRVRVLPVLGRGASPKKRLAFLAELASLGYQVENPASYDDSALLHYPQVIDTLKQMRGGDVAYVPLFDRFPDSVPEDRDYFARRVVGYVLNVIPEPPDGHMLESGVVVPRWLFDTDAFGADPITQLQDPQLFQRGKERQERRAGDDKVVWTTLRLLPAQQAHEALKGWLLDALYAASSIKEALKPDIEALLDHFGIEVVNAEKVTFKETRSYLMSHLWRKPATEQALSLARTPTDVLRLFAALTNTSISLATPITYPKLTRAQRRAVLEALERAPSLAEDLKRYSGLWKAIGKGLHPGEYARRFPKTAGAFEQLRRGQVTTWGTRVERALRHGDAAGAVSLLAERPGELGRRLHHLARLSEDAREKVLAVFARVGIQLTLKHLLVLEAHLRSIDELDRRTVINKKGTIRVLDNPHRLDPATRADLVGLVRHAIVVKLRRDKPSWRGKKVWIDSALRRVTVPLQQRKASDGLLNIGRGSQLPLEPSKVLRFFVYWKDATQRTDLDLSLISFGDDMQYLGHIDWTRLSAEGIVHSGDLQSAPQGAAEFIDAELGEIDSAVRYLAPQVHRYAGDSFGAMECHAGFMLREHVNKSYASFDIKTVKQKLPLTGSSGYAIPFLVDLKQRRVIYVDLYVGSVREQSTAAGAARDISTICQSVANMIDTRPNMLDLAQFHVRGRGAEEVDARSRADIVFCVGGALQTDAAGAVHYDAMQLERALAQLL